MPLLMFQHVQAARWDAIANAAVRSGCGATCQQGKFDPKKTAHNDQPWKRRVEKCMLYHVTSNLRANRACHNLRETSSQVCLSGEFSDDENSNPTIKVHQISSVYQHEDNISTVAMPISCLSWSICWRTKHDNQQPRPISCLDSLPIKKCWLVVSNMFSETNPNIGTPILIAMSSG
jgi:hypothetical protein